MAQRVPFHRIDLLTFCQETEEPEKVELALRTIVGERDIATDTIEGLFGNGIMVLRSSIPDQRGLRLFFEKLSEAPFYTDLVEQLDQRLDDECVLHFRFSKQAAFNGDLSLEKSGGVIQLQVKVAAYPAKRENALEAIQKFFTK